MDLLYLDLCCYKRPFDDQRDERVRGEAEAVAALIVAAEHGQLRLVCSPALRFEDDRNPREDRRIAASLWLDGASVEVTFTPAIEKRARELAALGFRPLDALHVAFGEAAGARALVTCDDHMLAVSARLAAALRINVVRPGAARVEGET